MKKNIKWLLAEIDRWVDQGVIEPAQAAALEKPIPAPVEAVAWSRIIFLLPGAALFGLGVVFCSPTTGSSCSKFANWAYLAALIGAHGAGGWLGRSAGRYRTAGEGFHLLGTMLFGAGIWLVAQIYHIEEHYPQRVPDMGLGALALAWALPSMAQGTPRKPAAGAVEWLRGL